MSIFESRKSYAVWGALPKQKIQEAQKSPNPTSKLISPYYKTDVSPEVSFQRKIYLHSISPQIQLGVTGYSRLLDLANIVINSDDEEAKKIIEDWNDRTDFKTKLETMGNTFLVCGNAILEKLDEKSIMDVAEVDMSSIMGKERDEFGNTIHYIQQTKEGPKKLGEGKLDKFIEFNLNTISRSTWSPCLFESAAIPRRVGNRNTLCLIELVVGLEDAMSTIVLNNAYPEVYYTFENSSEEELKKEAEKIRTKKPGDRAITTKRPIIDMFESKGQSAYVDYIKYLYNSISLAVKFPTDILTGDFTSRASSEESGDLPVKYSNAIKRYLGNKLKHELYDKILEINNIDPKKANLQVTFGIHEIVELTPADVLARFQAGLWSMKEAREFDKDNCGVDLFDENLINKQTEDKNKITPEDKKKLEVIKENKRKCRMCRESQHALCDKPDWCKCNHL